MQKLKKTGGDCKILSCLNLSREPRTGPAEVRRRDGGETGERRGGRGGDAGDGGETGETAAPRPSVIKSAPLSN